jgi:3-methyl-2-oxobutanoate hydroxymethyltransferase
MVMLGHPTTLPVTLDEMVMLAAAVARGAQNALLVGDLPFLSYQTSVEDALRSAGRFLKEAGMHAVKLEGGVECAETVRRLTSAGIPVMAHVGLTPQSVHAMGGFKIQGREPIAAARIREDARAMEEAGAFSVVLEGIPSDLAGEITAALRVPTIGIGAGPACDGQVLVVHDMLGLTTGKKPKFVKDFAGLGEKVVAAAKQYAAEVESGVFPAPEHGYGVTRLAEELKYGGTG